MGTRWGGAVTAARARVKGGGVEDGRRYPRHARASGVGDVLEEVVEELLRQSARWRHTRLALGVTPELALLALETLEKVLFAKYPKNTLNH